MKTGGFRLCMAACLMATLFAASTHADHPSMAYGEGSGGPIHTIPATTLPRGRLSLSYRFEYLNLDRLSDGRLEAAAEAGEHADSTDFVLSAFLGGAYGLADDLTIGARIPYVFRDDIREGHLHAGEAEAEEAGSSAGHGDLMLFGQYRLLDLEERDLELAVLGGLKVPTGFKSDRTRGGERFEVEHQPGSGSWDPIAGLAASRRRGRLSLHGSLLYTFATEGAQDTNLGDLLSYNLAAVYRLGGSDAHDHEGPSAADDHHHAPARLTWDLIVEANGEWREKIDIDGGRDDDSGGHLIYASPGIRVNLDERWSFFGSVGIPVFQDVNGNAHETDLRLVLGVSVGF
ncbi:MAG: transporter [Planctomycetota bacterium]